MKEKGGKLIKTSSTLVILLNRSDSVSMKFTYKKWSRIMETGRLFDSLSIKAGILAILALGGCIATTIPYMRTETAQRIAAPAWMIKRDVTATPFVLRAYERVHNRGGVANLYIEGDGDIYTSPAEWSIDPTPTNPVALHMASKDRADNVIYLARPCQYTATLSGQECDGDIWGNERFSENVINSYGKALDEIAQRYDIRGFHLIGYSGGGAIAALIASRRSDILSLRTVSGVLDHKTQTDLLHKEPLDASLNPTEIAASLIRLPQYHFIGGQDPYVPPAVLHSYLQSSPPSHCLQTMLVQEAGYDTGWVDKWPELLELPVTCYNKPHTPDFGEITPPAPPKEAVFTVREKPAKP